MSKYIVSLTPLDKYFFGGDMTFKVKGQEQYNERYGSYIIQSGLYPQQTSLLGMMRFLLLSHNLEAFDKTTNKIKSSEAATAIIGANGFAITNQYRRNDFKLIKNLSPCFLEILDENNQWKTLLPMPKDYGYEVRFNSEVLTAFNQKSAPMPTVVGYDPKEYKEEIYYDGRNTYKSSQLFVEDERVGIDKKYNGVTEKDDSSYYKQIYYRLGNKELSGRLHFAFHVEVDDSIDLTSAPYQHSIVSLGGDNSQFRFEAVPHRPDAAIAYNKDYNSKCAKDISLDYAKIILLSDSYLLRSEIEQCMYVISTTKPFRFLMTTTKTENYSILSKTNLRSNKFYLYEKGSVLFCFKDELQNIITALEKPCFQQIGYNHFQTIQ